MMKDITVLILAGGDSSRFWPLPDKNSLSFLGRPLIYHHLFQLDRAGFKRVVVAANKDNILLFDGLKKEFPRLNIDLAVQSDKRGMAGAVISAEKFIRGRKLIIKNGSDIYDDLLFSIFRARLKGNPDGIITGITQDSYFPGGYLKIENDKVTGIVEKPGPDKLPSRVITIVFDYFKNADDLLEAISAVTSCNDDIFEKAIDLLIKKGTEFKFMSYSGYWGYLKSPWHVLDVNLHYLSQLNRQKIGKATIHKSANVSGNVYIEDNVRILENAKIVGPAYIGYGTLIGQNCLVREAMIGAGCVVGFGTEIARSYIGESCWFHSNYVGDSVLSSNVSMGAGAVLANYKLSEGQVKSLINGKKTETGKIKLGSMIGENVRIGVNSSVMPGVKIGKNSFVGSGIVLDRDLPEDKYVYLPSTGLIIKDNRNKLPVNSRKEVRQKLKI